MFAVAHENIEVVECLIAAGAVVNVKNKKSETALTKAKENAKLHPLDKSWKEIIELLKSVGAIN